MTVTMKREIIRAEYAGFCFGVKRAIKQAEDILEAKRGEKVYSCGSLIHNKIVTDELEEKGLITVDSPLDADKGSTIIVRSHGEPKSFYDVSAERNLCVIDATCPFVQKIHELVHEAGGNGEDVVIVGDAAHPEVIGIKGWCSGEAVAINTTEEARGLCAEWKALAGTPEFERPVFVVAQTTIRKEIFEEICDILRESGRKITVKNTVCSATAERQKSCMEIAKKCDIMIIVGDKKSSNTKKLYDIAKKYCEKTYFVENIEYLPLKEIEKCNKIGITAGASTPERVIMEVIANMSENITESMEANFMDDFMDEIEKSLRLPRSGEIVTGTIIQVTNKEIIVNLGCKKDGIIPMDELTLEGDQKISDLYKEGDEIQAKVVKIEDGEIILSKKKLEVSEHWDEISKALDDKETISVKVIREVKGGVIAAYKEVTGFIPLSQLSDKFVESAAEFIGKVLPVRVSRVDKMKGRAVFSHKAILAEEKARKIAEIWSSLNVGDVVEGTVMRFTDYGAFVDIGGIDGLLHISEISWGKLKNPQEVLTIGQKIQVKVLAMNEEKGKISLGLKQTQPEPWSVIDEKFTEGQVVTGKVVQIKEYGAFVELEPGLDGLVHISEVANRRVTNIAEELTVGQEVDAKILEIDKERKRISLSIKACLPEEEVSEEA